MRRKYAAVVTSDSSPLSQATIRQYNKNLRKILIVSDITDSKKAEQELREGKTKTRKPGQRRLAQANISLEQKVAERNPLTATVEREQLRSGKFLNANGPRNTNWTVTNASPSPWFHW